MGGILFPKYRGKLFEDEDLKTTENWRLGPEGRQNAPRTFEKCLGHVLTSHAPRAFSMHLGNDLSLSLMRLGNFICAPCMQKVVAQLSFPASELGKVRTFIPNPGRNSHYKYQSSLLRKATLEFQDSFYFLLDFLGYIFIFSNLCFSYHV